MTETQYRKLERELFEMVYMWGKTGIVTDELCPAFQSKLDELLAGAREEAESKGYTEGLERGFLKGIAFRATTEQEARELLAQLTEKLK